MKEASGILNRRQYLLIPAAVAAVAMVQENAGVGKTVAQHYSTSIVAATANVQNASESVSPLTSLARQLLARNAEVMDCATCVAAVESALLAAEGEDNPNRLIFSDKMVRDFG